MKKFTLMMLFTSLLVILPLGAEGQTETSEQASGQQKSYLASNTWTAAFAELGGLDNVYNLAPANLVHPPEYELTPSDIQKLSQCHLFIYAGYEVMMKTLGDSTISQEKMVQITTTNDLETVQMMADKIAKIANTEEVSTERVAQYKKVIEEGRAMVKKLGLDTLSVYCNFHQKDIAEDLGLHVQGVFGPGPITPVQIKEVAKNNYDLIIDNIHNPLSSPLAEISPKSKVVSWRNFPEDINPNSLADMESENFKMLANLYQ